MKASDFMIGDWVDIFPTYCQVLSIGKKGRIYTTTVSNYKVESDIGVFINNEILEANGFVRKYDDSDLDFYWEEGKQHIEIWQRCNLWYIQTWINHDISDLFLSIKYVHELQHAMRLMGLNELADNFKVEGGAQ